MKFLQYMSFYSAYLDAFYRDRPHLENAGFAEQMAALAEDGFSEVHMFAPVMAAHGYDTHLAGINAVQAQRAWAREHGLPAGAHPLDIARIQIDTIRPDVLYITDPTMLDPCLLRTCNWRPRLVVIWRAAPVPRGVDWSDVDVMVSSHSGCRDLALKLGAAAVEPFRPGFPERVADRLKAETEHWDLVFTGQIGSLHRRRTEFLQHLVAAPEVGDRRWNLGLFLVNAPQSIPPEIQPHAQPSLWGMEMYRTLRRGRISLNVHIDMAGSESQNMRVFEVTGAGGFLLTDHGHNIGDLFEPGREIETFRSPGEMLEKIRYYLAHEDERRAIAERGQQRCLRDHGLGARAADLDRIIRRHLPRADAIRQARGQALADAEAALAAGDIARAGSVIAGLLERWPRHADVRRLQGMLLLRQAQAEHALAVLNEGQGLAPVDLRILSLRIEACLALGRQGQAIEMVQGMLRYFPGHAGLRQKLAQLQAAE